MTDTDTSNWRTDHILDLAERMLTERLAREDLEELACSEDPDTRRAAVVAMARQVIETVAPLGQSLRLRDTLPRFIQRLIAKTQNSVPAPGWWIGDQAAERRTYDNLGSGAVYARSAHQFARDALEAFDKGEFEKAEADYEMAKDYWIAALEQQVTPSGLDKLSTGRGLRGRPATKDDRNLRLAVAVAEQEQLGLRGAVARQAAFNAHPTLKKEFASMSDDGVRKAVERGRKRLATKS